MIPQIMYKWYHFSQLAIVIIFMLSFSLVLILCYHLCYHFLVVIICVIIWCYHFSWSANVIIFMLSFSLVHILRYHLCYHLMLSFIVIISPLFFLPENVTHSETSCWIFCKKAIVGFLRQKNAVISKKGTKANFYIHLITSYLVWQRGKKNKT